jgi:antirestriction protein
MTLKEKIDLINVDKTKDPTKTKEVLNRIEKLGETQSVKAMEVLDQLIAKMTLENPDALKKAVISREQAKRKASKLSTLRAIVPKKADVDKIELQIKKQYPKWDDDKIKQLAQLRIDAQISRADNFNKMLDTLSKSQFYGGKELSTAPIDKGRGRNLQKDSKQGSITEAEELKMTKKKFKRISKAGRKNQYGTTKGGNVYYEYRMNRRDVDNKIRLAKGGGVGIPNADKMFHLPYELAVYVPSTMNVDKSITATELRARVKEVEKYLAETFGGFTSAEKVGGYLSSKSSVITEKVIPVTAFATNDSFTANKSKLVNKLSVWAKKWGQEAIGFEFEGDLYYVPQKFKKGGKLTATYIPKYDIKTLTTVWGNNIKGKDLIDGAYTIRKNIKKRPKMVRSMFEEEEFSEFKKGGLIAYSNNDYQQIVGNFSTLAEAKKFAKANKGKYQTITFEDEYGDNIVVEKSDTIKDIDWLFSEKYAKGGKPKTVRYYFEDEAYEYAKGGRVKYYLNGFEEGINYILNSTDAVEVKREGNLDNGNLVIYFETRDNKKAKSGKMKVAKYGRGTKLSSDDTPKVWIGEWSLYNEGKLIGEWVDLSEYDSGAEVMDKIQALLDKWTKETGRLREEYAVFDYENFSSSLYSEGMGEASFDKVITAYKLSQETDIPSDVLSTIMAEYDLNDEEDLQQFIDERYIGYFENDSDLGYYLVDDMGEGVQNLSQNTIEMYFDYEGYGRDTAMNDMRDIDGYYFYNR